MAPLPELIDLRFRENKPKTLVFSHRKRAYWACFHENLVYNFGHLPQGKASIGGVNMGKHDEEQHKTHNVCTVVQLYTVQTTGIVFCLCPNLYIDPRFRKN
jgi:hypothetical protein